MRPISNRRGTPGTWADANSGTGVGGTGANPNAPVALSSNDRPAGREGAPYQDWAAKKVMESFNRRGIDDPTAQCLPGGLPRSVMLGLFPQQFVATPSQVVMLYEYMNVHRVITLNAKHPDDPGSMQSFAFGYGYIKALIQAVNSEVQG